MTADGSLDSLFRADANNYATGLALQSNGKINVSGSFTEVAGFVRNGLVRLNPTGDVDSFDPNVSGTPFSISLQTDGKLVLGGTFSSIGGLPRMNLGRIRNDQLAIQDFVLTGKTIVWRRGGSMPELTLPPELSISSDGQTYTDLGAMQRDVDQNWRFIDLPIQSNVTFFVKFQGATGDGVSQGLIQSVAQLASAELENFADGFE